MFLKLDGTFVVQLINFAIFFAILNFVFLRPVSAAIRKRREYINGLTHDYDRYQAEATSLRTQAEGIRAAARREGEHLLTQIRAKTSNETAEIAARYAGEVTETVEHAHAVVAGELQGARTDEERIVRQLAGMMVERTLAGAAP